MRRVNVENHATWHDLHELSSRRHPFTPDDDPADIAAWVHAVYIRTSRDIDLLRAIQRTVRRNGSTKRHWLGLDAPANSGKSEMLLRFAIGVHHQAGGPPDQTPERTAPDESADQAARPITLAARPHETDTFQRVPILYIQADSGQQGAGLLRTIAETAGIPSQGSEDALRRRLAHVLPRMGTVIVIVDDAHMLRRVSDRATKLTDSIRASLRLPVTFVFSGAGLHASALLRIGGPVGYESTEQLRSRHTMLTLPPLTLRTDRNYLRRLIGDYLKTLSAVVPQLDTPFRSDNVVLGQLVEATDGRVGALMGLLKDGTIEALHRGEPLSSQLLLQLASHQAETTP